MNGTCSGRRTPSPRVVALCLTTATLAVVPSVAAFAAAASGPATLRATVDANGAAKAVSVINADGTTKSWSGQLPVKLSISRSAANGTETYTYHVENTVSKSETVHYDDTAGHAHHAAVTVQLPLVAQLGVDLPASVKNVSAAGATVSTDSAGYKHVLWNMVLFAPLGSPVQDVSFTATGSGTPVAELRATAVTPSSTAGLSTAGSDATASQQQDDFWATYAKGANGGLKQLSDGTQQLVAGLEQLYTGANQLHTGLGAAQTGANQLDAGTKQAYQGSQDLHAGLGKIHDGQGALTGGLGAIHAGQGQLTGGLADIHTGVQAFEDETTGLPAAVKGVQQIRQYLNQVIAGIGTGSDTDPYASLLGDLNAVDAGLKSAYANLRQLDDGLACSNRILATTINGSATTHDVPNANDPCWQALVAGFAAQGVDLTRGLPGTTDALAVAIINAMLGSATQAGTLRYAQTALDASLQPPSASNPATFPAAIAGVDGAIAALTHAAGTKDATDPGGIREVLQQLNGPAGLGKLLVGLKSAVEGVGRLDAGTLKALGGSQALLKGSGQALSGSQKLYAGSRKAYAGSGKLESGLGKLSAGQHKVATGLPAAVDGSGKIATGLGQALDAGVDLLAAVGQVNSGATGPLEKQLTTASQNQHQALAVLAATSDLAAQSPGGSNAVYVLSQDTKGFALAADSTNASASHTGRNVGIGVAGVVLLLAGVGGGFVMGRTRRAGASA